VLLVHKATEMCLICDEGRVSFEARPQEGGMSSNALWRLQPLGVEWGGATPGGRSEGPCIEIGEGVLPFLHSGVLKEKERVLREV